MSALTNRSGSSAVLAWPIGLAIALPILLIILEATPIGLDFIYTIFVEPALLIFWGLAGACAAIIAIKQMWRREWKTAGASTILPICVLLVSLRLFTFIHFCNYVGDLLYFLVERSFYLQAIDKRAVNGEPRLLVFDRGGMSWASRGFVYDESDELLKEPSLQSASWKKRAEATKLSCGYNARALPGQFDITKHWYVASFPC